MVKSKINTDVIVPYKFKLPQRSFTNVLKNLDYQSDMKKIFSIFTMSSKTFKVLASDGKFVNNDVANVFKLFNQYIANDVKLSINADRKILLYNKENVANFKLLSETLHYLIINLDITPINIDYVTLEYIDNGDVAKGTLQLKRGEVLLVKPHNWIEFEPKKKHNFILVEVEPKVEKDGVFQIYKYDDYILSK